MTTLAERLAGLSPEQKAKFIMNLKRAPATDNDRGQLRPRATGSNTSPLSFAQQRLWVLDQVNPRDPAYNMVVALRLEGALDAGALERSLNDLVRRHEVLRTTFGEVDDQPVQLISPVLRLGVEMLDVRHTPANGREAEARRLVSEQERRPFDLGRGPLLRCALIRLGEKEHVLVLTMHHIISDGWSIGIIIRELMAFYGAATRNAPAGLPPLPVQYADFAQWQRQWLQGAELERQLAFWTGQLKGAPSRLELPTDYARPEVQSFRGAAEEFLLPKEEAEALKRLGRAEDATLFMTLLAAFKVLLHHLSGSEDILVGSDIANRNPVQTEPLIGFFVNQLVMRTRLHGNPTFLEILRRVRGSVLRVFDHQDLPFQRVVDALRLERDLSRNPLFQVMFAFQNIPAPSLESRELALSGFDYEIGSTVFDISLLAAEGAAGLQVFMRYSTDLFTSQTIQRMFDRLKTTVRQVTANPEVTLGELRDVLAEADRREEELTRRERKSFNTNRLESIRRKRAPRSLADER
ncbi:MAG: hypothetical protein QOJ70_2341 [Acidobacteriota bacterium]|jgi:hypothetical protein|nr:hypothetical protein [Acidobacteriota bacterium]